MIGVVEDGVLDAAVVGDVKVDAGDRRSTWLIRHGRCEYFSLEDLV